MKIKAIRMWHAADVQGICIKYDLYTRGTAAEFEKMFDFIKHRKPTTRNIYKVACDINDHSEGQTITNIMCLIENFAVRTVFEIEEEDQKEANAYFFGDVKQKLENKLSQLQGV